MYFMKNVTVNVQFYATILTLGLAAYFKFFLTNGFPLLISKFQCKLLVLLVHFASLST